MVYTDEEYRELRSQGLIPELTPRYVMEHGAPNNVELIEVEYRDGELHVIDARVDGKRI